MKKKLFLSVPFAIVVLMLSGCSLPGTSSSGKGASVMKSTDGGKTYVPKVIVDPKTTIASANILSLVFESGNARRLTLGTRENGIFVSDDGGEAWRKLDFPPIKTYGLVSDWSRPERLYATGEWQGRGKIYRSDDRGMKWEELYAEPNTGTVITALAQSPRNPLTLYAGTSAGVIIRTTDGGLTWQNLEAVSGPALSFVFDSSGEAFYILTSGKGIARSKDGGATFESIPGKSRGSVTKSLPEITALAIDSLRSGTLYAGTKDGLFRSSDFGDAWEEIPVIESAKQFPIRSVAVNPENSREIIFNAALAVYKSMDAGTNWSVYQLDSSRAVGTLRYDPTDSNVIYLGLRTFN